MNALHPGRTDVLARAAQAINSVLDRPVILRRVVEFALELVGGARGSFGEVRDGRMAFAEAYLDGRWQPAAFTLAPGEGAAGELLLRPGPCVRDGVVAMPLTCRGGELVGCFQVHDHLAGAPVPPLTLELLGGLAAITSTALENARLLRELEQAERRSSLLASVSTALSESLDFRSTLRTVAELTVQWVADWVTINLRAPDTGRLERVAVVHRDPSKAAAVEAYRTRFPPTEHRADLKDARDSLRARFFRSITEEQLLASAQDPVHLAVLRELGSSSVIFAPMLVRGESFGLISLMRAEGAFSDADVTLAEELAGRAALALENARLFQAERKARSAAESERNNLRSLFLQTPASVAIVRAPELRYELSNPENQRLARLTEPMEGKTLDEVLTPDQVAQLRPLVEEVLRTGVPFVGTEVPVSMLDGSGRTETRYLNGTYQPLRGPDGQVSGVMAFAYDVTPQVRARQQVEALARDLEAAIRSKDEFLSIASHELKTPLTSLQLKLAAALRQLDPARQAPPDQERLRRDITVAQRQVRRLADLVKDLMDVSRLAQGRMSIALEPVELRALLHDVMARFTPDAAAAGSTLRLRAEVEVVGHWDRMRLEQVVSNLLSNAIKYGAGTPIEVELERVGESAQLVVIDGGIGIPAEVLPRIFDRFVRGVSDRHYGGLGLGLFITRQIVTLLGGSIGVASTEGQGARFTVSLPLSGPAQR